MLLLDWIGRCDRCGNDAVGRRSDHAVPGGGGGPSRPGIDVRTDEREVGATDGRTVCIASANRITVAGGGGARTARRVRRPAGRGRRHKVCAGGSSTSTGRISETNAAAAAAATTGVCVTVVVVVAGPTDTLALIHPKRRSESPSKVK